MFIDSHAHLDFKEFDSDRNEVIQRAQIAGVFKIINVGANLERSKKSLELANQYDIVYATLGIHPYDCQKDDLNLIINEFKKLAKSSKVVAIGEIGLDYYRLETNNQQLIIEKQKEVLKTLLNLALELNLPIILHCRHAYEDMLEALKMPKVHKAQKGVISHSTWCGVTHCFSDNWKIAQKFLGLGFYLGFTGAITYPGKNAAKIEEVIKNTSLERILIETDCPYLAPIPYRGSRNEPAYVVKVAEKIAGIKNLPLEEVAKQTTKNAMELFKLK